MIDSTRSKHVPVKQTVAVEVHVYTAECKLKQNIIEEHLAAVLVERDLQLSDVVSPALLLFQLAQGEHNDAA